MGDGERGPSFWKFNSTLVNDSDYRFLLDENIKKWLEEFKEAVDKRVLWDLLNIKFDSSLSSIAKKKLTVGKPRSKIWKKNYRTVPKIVKMTRRKKMFKN